MKKKTGFLIALLLVAGIAVQGFASFPSTGIFYARVNRIHSRNVKDRNNIYSSRVTMTLLKHATGRGRMSDRFAGKVGSTVTVTLKYGNKRTGRILKPSVFIWVKYSEQPSTWGRYTWKSWTLPGEKMVVLNPVKWSGKRVSSRPFKILWVVRRNGILSIEVAFRGRRRYLHSFDLVRDKNREGRIMLRLVHHDKENTKFGKKRTKLLQFDIRKFKGSKILIYAGGKLYGKIL